MKILKIILISFVILTILIFVGILIFLQFFKIDQHLPQITKNISQSIGRQVNINHADLSFDLIHGLVLDLKVLTISDQLTPDAHDFIVIDKSHIGLDLTALIFKREIRATDLRFNTIHVYLEPYHFLIQDIRMKVDRFSLNKPFSFKIDINAYSKAADNIEINGHGLIDLKNNSFQIKDLKIKSDLNQWNWAKLRAVTPGFKDVLVWPIQDLKGNVSIVIPNLIVSSQGLGDFSIELQSQIGGGDVDVKVDFKDLSKYPKYEFKIYSKAVKVEDIIDQKSWPVGFKGAITGNFLGSGQGFESPLMFDHLEGQGDFQLSDSKFERLNILRIILDKLNVIPSLGNVFQAVLPSEINDKLNTDATILEKINIKIGVLNKIISIHQAQIVSSFFSILAQGSISFDMKTNINVNTYLASDISIFFIKAIPPLKGLLDEQKKIYIPGKLIGQVPSSIAYWPEEDYIIKKIMLSEGSEQINQQLEKVLDKNPEIKNVLNAVFGKSSSQNDSSSEDQQLSDDNSSDQKVPRKLINNILKDILN